MYGKVFELIEKMYVEMQNGFEKVDERFDKVENELSDVKDKVAQTNITIEHEIKPKLTALFDGYKQNSDKLDRIEKEVSKHEEIILRRIK